MAEQGVEHPDSEAEVAARSALERGPEPEPEPEPEPGREPERLPREQWLDGVDTGPSAAVSEMQAVEDDLAWRLQSTLWRPSQSTLAALATQHDTDTFVHEQTAASGRGTGVEHDQSYQEESEESELPEFIVQLDQVRVLQ